jgi:hypothetical protein
MFVEERRKVTLICTPNLKSNIDEGILGPGQQPLRLFHPAPNHIAVRSQPGGGLEQACKMGRACLLHGGKRDQREFLRQMRFDIGDRTPQFVERKPIVPIIQEVASGAKTSEKVDRERID